MQENMPIRKVSRTTRPTRLKVEMDTSWFCNFSGHIHGPQWVEVEYLGGDRILFLSKASNKPISATSLSLSYGDYKKRVEGNCICFAFDNPCLASPWMGRDFGVFSLTNKNIQRFIVPNNHPRTSLFNTQTVWFTLALAS